MNSSGTTKLRMVLLASTVFLVLLSKVEVKPSDSPRAEVLIDITGSTSRLPMSLLGFNMHTCSQCLINIIIGSTIKNTSKYFFFLLFVIEPFYCRFCQFLA